MGAAVETLKLSDVLDKVAGYNPAPDLDLIKSAYVFAAKVHEGQVRKSGEPYLMHPLAVADIVATLKLDEASICAALLHDTVEDTLATVEDISELFGAEIAHLVDGLTKLAKVSFRTKEERQAENFRKMLIAMSRDIRVILVKLADRTHNMRTLKHLPEAKRTAIAVETLDIYAPLANRLGISWIKTELEDLSFRYIWQDDYYELAEKVNKTRKAREKYTEDVVRILKDVMAESDLAPEVSGRPKHLYSIWRKMKAQNIEFEQVYDAIAFRLILDSIKDCYEALGAVHTHWKPIPGRFKDYIALPKPNMYRSLHTAVIGPRGERIEIQIRTHEMHRIAEEGIAAHWKYKEGAAMNMKDEQKFAWLKQLMEWQRELKDPNEFLDTVKVDLFSEEVYVFTPAGDVRVFPKGATPVDFAYSIHSEVGHHCTGARVGGVMVPLTHSLRNGDIVEILTSKTQRPSADWVRFVKTARAKARIKAFLRQEQRDKSLAIGRELLEKELRKYSMSLAKISKNGRFQEVCEKLRAANAEDLYVLVGYGKVRPDQVSEALVPPEERQSRAQEPPKEEGRIATFLKSLGRRKGGVRVDGIEDLLVRYGSCCNPVPGDDIVGFITRGRGVTVHTRDCPHAGDSDPDRMIDVVWDAGASAAHAINLRVVSADAPGLLAQISQSFTNEGVNISQAHCTATEDHKAVNLFQIHVANLDQLQSVMRNIGRIKGVFSVERVRA